MPAGSVPYRFISELPTDAQRELERNFLAVSGQLLWVSDALGNVSLATVATAFNVNATSDIVLETSTGLVKLKSDLSEIDLDAYTYVTITSATQAVQISSAKVDASGLTYGVSLATTGGSGLKLSTSGIGRMTLDSGGPVLIRATGGGVGMTIATTDVNGDLQVSGGRTLDLVAAVTAQLRSVGGASAVVNINTNTSLGNVYIGNTGANSESVHIHGELISIDVGNVDGNYFGRVGGVWKGVTPSFLSTALTSAHLFVGSAGNVATDTALTGDISITNAGVSAIGALKVATGMIAANAVTLAKLATQADQTVLGNVSGGVAVPVALTVAQQKTMLGLGTAAFTAASAYDIAGAAGAAQAASQPLDSDLTTLAGLTATTDNFVVSVSSAWASRTPAQVMTTLGAAPLASPTLTGTPAAPTAGAGTNTTQLATTAFVTAAVGAVGAIDPALISMEFH